MYISNANDENNLPIARIEKNWELNNFNFSKTYVEIAPKVKYNLILNANEKKSEKNRARSHGLVVKADGSWPRGCGLETQHCLLDECKQFASYYIKEKIF
jgi:hypothetical protein